MVFSGLAGANRADHFSVMQSMFLSAGKSKFGKIHQIGKRIVN